MENKRLSKHFWLKEFFVSSTYPEYAQKLFENCTQQQEDQFMTLAREIEKVRSYAEILAPDPRIEITRGYQDAHLNRLIGGTENSYHTRNIAVDFRMWDKKYNYILRDLFDWMPDNVPVGELGLYETEDGDYTNIHWSLTTVDKQNVIWHKVRTPKGLVNKDDYKV